MASTVQIPGDGTVKSRWLLVGGALVVGIVGYAYLHRSTASSGEPIPPTPVDLPPADLGSVTTGGGTTDTGLQFITTDAQWSADVLAKMEALAFDTNAVSIALGKWLNGQAVSKQEEQWIFAAIALAGMPPSGSHPIRLEPLSTDGTDHISPKTKLAAPTNLRASRFGSTTSFQLSWNRVPGALSYLVKRETGPGSPTSAMVLGTARITPPLQRRHTYQYRVQAHAPGKISSDWSAPVRFKA